VLPAGDKLARLINIDGNPPEVPACDTPGDPPPVLTAVRGLLQARTAHAALALEEFKRAASTKSLDVVFDLEEIVQEKDRDLRCKKLRHLHHAPLGWYISHSGARFMTASAGLGKVMLCNELGDLCKPGNSGRTR
jgi:hypothetical protein